MSSVGTNWRGGGSQAGFDRVSRQIGSGLSFVERWEGDRLHFSAGAFGQKVVGRVDVLE